MTAVVRLTLVSHAMTDAVAAGRFPTDEPVNALGRRQVEPLLDVETSRITAVCGPEQRCLQTAELLGLQAEVEPRVSDLDCGRWRGNALGGVLPAELAVWLTDPTQAPHGGESVVDVINRVAGWLDSLTGTRSHTVAVTHPAVVRAAIVVALDAPPRSFWRVDVAPASRTRLHFRGHAWTVRVD